MFVSTFRCHFTIAYKPGSLTCMQLVLHTVAGGGMFCDLSVWNTGVRTLETGSCGSRMTCLPHHHFVQLFQIAMTQ